MHTKRFTVVAYNNQLGRYISSEVSVTEPIFDDSDIPNAMQAIIGPYWTMGGNGSHVDPKGNIFRVCEIQNTNDHHTAMVIEHPTGGDA